MSNKNPIQPIQKDYEILLSDPTINIKFQNIVLLRILAEKEQELDNLLSKQAPKEDEPIKK